MDLNSDAMLVSLRIAAWSGRLYDRKATAHVAVHHDASASAGRYNKRLLPKDAFAALTATVSRARSAHYEQTLPWDDKGARLLTVANYERYTELMDGLCERMVRERARFIEDYEDNIERARLDLGRLFRIEDYPSGDALRRKFAIAYRIARCRTRSTSWRSSPATTPTGSGAASSATSRNGCTERSAICTGAWARPWNAFPSGCARTTRASRWCFATP